MCNILAFLVEFLYFGGNLLVEKIGLISCLNVQTNVATKNLMYK